jgi:hypothetical protein
MSKKFDNCGPVSDVGGGEHQVKKLPNISIFKLGLKADREM